MTNEHRWGRWELPLAVGAAWWIDKVFTVEWSYAYCSIRDDGPAGAVRGFPFPYEQASIVTSATSFFIPWLYVINLAAIAGAVFLLLRFLVSLLGPSKPRFTKFILGAAGSLLLVTAIALETMVFFMDVWIPISSFGGTPPYMELRPVAINVLGRQRDCTASPYWFPKRTR